MTYNELLITFSLLYEQTLSATTDADTRGKFINLAAINITNRYKWAWRVLPVSDTLDGTATFDLPTDFHNDGFVVDSVFVGDEMWSEIQQDDVSMFSSDSQVFYITGSELDGYTLNFPKSVPDALSVIEYSYYRQHPELTDAEDETFIPDGECICNIAVGRFLKSEGEGEEGISYLQDGENSIVDMMKAQRRNNPVRRVKKDSRIGVDKFDIDSVY